MWKKPTAPVPIHPSQIVLGLYIWIDLPWDDHPFLYNRFKINETEQLEVLKTLALAGKLYYYPEKSEATPAPSQESEPPGAAAPSQAQEALRDALTRRNKEKKEQLWQQKDAAARADRAWEAAARATREAMLSMRDAPRQAGIQLQALSQQTAKKIAEGQEILLHLLGDKNGEGPQFHALNVMTLSMLLGKVAGLNEKQLADLALGALAHDIGKVRIPPHLLKTKVRAKHEEAFYRDHVKYGLELAMLSQAFSPPALEILSQHHEYVDGSGWPAGRSGPQLSTVSRIVALVNRYDRLCSPESPEKEALMPAEALARLFRTETARFDGKLLSLMIKLLGVYPPGTVVRLNDDALGLVVSPGRDSLRPTVLIYTPEVNKKEAPTVDLAKAPQLKIEEALRPSTLPPDVQAWMNPRQRLSYFYSSENVE